MKNLIKKAMLTVLISTGVIASAGAFAEKVVINKGCNGHGCHYTKKWLSTIMAKK